MSAEELVRQIGEWIEDGPDSITVRELKEVAAAILSQSAELKALKTAIKACNDGAIICEDVDLDYFLNATAEHQHRDVIRKVLEAL